MKLKLKDLEPFKNGEIVIRGENPPFTLTGRISQLLLGAAELSVRCDLRRLVASGVSCTNETIRRWVLSSMDPDYTVKLDEFSLVESPAGSGWLCFSRDLADGVTEGEEVVTLIPLRAWGKKGVVEEVEVI